MKTGIYKHYKGGYYLLLGVGQHTETNEIVVVYVSLDASLPGPRLRVRPYDQWTEVIAWGDGSIKPRFEYQGTEL